ncbi:hypothetical protein [Leifsonia sp. NPDC058248]|uniref:hypothetical protein n=1 Tax=Leifsonia sp. NPDC058248 TaxID=3346402 RepID=UPI0036DC5A6F
MIVPPACGIVASTSHLLLRRGSLGGWNINVDDEELVEKAEALGLVAGRVEEALHALKARWRITVDNSLSGSSVVGVNEEVWLQAMRGRGMNIGELRNRILVDLANAGQINPPTAAEIGPITVGMLLKTLEDDDLVTLTHTVGELTPA